MAHADGVPASGSVDARPSAQPPIMKCLQSPKNFLKARISLTSGRPKRGMDQGDLLSGGPPCPGFCMEERGHGPTPDQRRHNEEAPWLITWLITMAS